MSNFGFEQLIDSVRLESTMVMPSPMDILGIQRFVPTKDELPTVMLCIVAIILIKKLLNKILSIPIILISFAIIFIILSK